MKNITLLLLISLFSLALPAQEENTGPEYEFYNIGSTFTFMNSSFLQEVQTVIMNNGMEAINDKLLIKQIGEANNMEVTQNLDFSSTYINASLQLGTGNSGYINQTGNNHQSILVQNNKNVLCSSDAQLGNKANLWSEGANTQNMVLQVGNSNVVDQFVENYYATTRSVASVQIGNNNKIELAVLEREEQNNLLGVLVTQTGNANSAELVLEQSEAPYLKIDQMGGADIKITQSDFYFPMK